MRFLQSTQGISVAFLFFALLINPGYAYAGFPKKLKSLFHSSQPVIQVKKDTVPTTEIEDEAIKYEDQAAINQLFELAWDNDVLDPFRKEKPFLGATFDCSSFGLPIPVTKVISKYGVRHKRMHTGTDIKLYAGDTIVSIADGKVRFAKYYGGYGNVVIIRHANGLESLYAHMSKICVDINQPIQKGELVGLGGRTGRATGTHLHFEIRLAGRPINPESIYDFSTGTICNVSHSKEVIPLEKDKDTRTHKVVSGETLFAISKKYGLSLSNLYAWNNMDKKTILSIGQEIVIQQNEIESIEQETVVAQKTFAEQKPIAEQKIVAEQKPVAVEKIAQVKKIIEVQKPAAEKTIPEVHIIQKGETLYALAKQYGTTISEICRINNLDPDGSLRLGQKIQLKERGDQPIKKVASHPQPIHVVRDGDNLGKIARKYKMSIENLCELNGIERNGALRIGQKIKTIQ